MADSYDCSTRGSTLKSGWHRFYTHTAWREQCPSAQTMYHDTRNPAPPEKGATADTLEAARVLRAPHAMHVQCVMPRGAPAGTSRTELEPQLRAGIGAVSVRSARRSELQASNVRPAVVAWRASHIR